MATPAAEEEAAKLELFQAVTNIPDPAFGRSCLTAHGWDVQAAVQGFMFSDGPAGRSDGGGACIVSHRLHPAPALLPHAR